jgi:hypothetical protein
LTRRAECPACRRDAKVCLNCRFFDRGAHHECLEEQAEWVPDKEMGNFCTYFEGRGETSPEAAKDQVQARLKGLFKEPGTGGAQAPAPSLAADLARFLASKK